MSAAHQATQTAVTTLLAPRLGELKEAPAGTEVAQGVFVLSRDSLVRYAGASGDFNPIHYRDDVARAVGLDGVLAHGMLTMGVATSAVSAWLTNQGVVIDAQARFSRPVPVDPDAVTEVSVSVKLKGVDTDSGTAELQLAVTVDGRPVLAKPLVVVRFHAA